MLMQIARNDPMINQLVQIGNQYGGDYDKALQDLSQKNGINVKEIVNML